MKTVAIIQARMGSTRLPGKALVDLANEPMLARVVHRVQRAGSLHEVIVATTVQPADDAIAQCCAMRGWPCARGSQDDVLDRYYQAALASHADVVVRITSDCPLIDPEVIDQVVGNREIVVKSGGPQLASVPGIFGATIMGDGSVVVILDVAPLVRRAAALPRDAAPVQLHVEGGTESGDTEGAGVYTEQGLKAGHVAARVLHQDGPRHKTRWERPLRVDGESVRQQRVACPAPT